MQTNFEFVAGEGLSILDTKGLNRAKYVTVDTRCKKS